MATAKIMKLGDQFKIQKKNDSRVWTVIEHDPATGAVTGKGDDGVTYTREDFCIPLKNLTPIGVNSPAIPPGSELEKPIRNETSNTAKNQSNKP